MNQKLALTLATFMTAFSLVLGGAIVGRSAQPTPTPTLQPTLVPTATTEDIQSIYSQREALYQARLAEANRALAQAYAELGAATASASTSTPTPQASALDITITHRDAIAIALQAVPGATSLGSSLVYFQGVTAYEVVLDRGNVYVDANTGAVLYNGAAQTQDQIIVPGGGGGDDDHDD